MPRNNHPNKEIEAVLQHAENNGWRVKESNGHPWGQTYCPYHMDPCCDNGMWCRMSVWSTPANPQKHAKKLKDKIDHCVVIQEKREAIKIAERILAEAENKKQR